MDVFGVNQPQLDSSRLGGMGARGDASDAGPPPKEWARPKRPKLDKPEHQQKLRKLREWLEVERIRQAPNRYQQAIDQDFYDGLQWGDQEAAELQERGQAPLVYNKTQPAVKWITGTEKRTRIDWKVLPRNEDGIKDAAIKTKLLKYVQDVNKSQFSRSRAFEDAVKVGVGWLESGIRADPTMELLYDRSESWRNMLYDSTGCEYDLSDSRYLFRMRWVDLDIAQAMFPESMNELRQVSVYSDFADAQDSDEYYLGQLLQERSPDGTALNRRTFVDTSMSLFNRRARVKLYECWYRQPENRFYMSDRSGALHHLHNTPFDQQDPEHLKAYQQQAVSLFQRMSMSMQCAVFVDGHLLQDQPSPYKHNDFPFTPIWGNRRGRDNAPYGVVRVIRDPQEDFNKRMSKALYALSTRRVVMEEGAVDDIDELREEVARPDSIIVLKKGFKDRIEIHTDTEVAEEHLHYAEIDARMIQDLSGVTDELLGKKTNATSGIAIERRQDQGSTVTTDFFDNLRLGTQLHGQKQLSLTKQYYTETKVLRIVGTRRGDEFETINQPGVDPDTGQPTILNDVTKNEADFVVTEQDFRDTTRQAMFDTMMQLLQKLPPQVALMLLDDMLEFADVPGVQQMVQTVRSITGKPDPDKHMSQEEKAQALQQQMKDMQRQEAMKDLQVGTAKANLDKLVAQAEELRAKAAKLGTEGDNGSGAASDIAYREKLYAIQKRTDDAVYQLRKQLMEAEARAELHAQGDEAKRDVANIGSHTTLMKTLLDNESRERIAAINDRTLEATKGLKADIAGLDDDLKQLERLKVDKPTPQDEAKALIDDHNAKLKDKAQHEATHARIDDVAGKVAATKEETHARMDDLAGTLKGVGAQAKAASKAATKRPAAKGGKAAPAAPASPDLSALVAAVETLSQQVGRLMKAQATTPEPAIAGAATPTK